MKRIIHHGKRVARITAGLAVLLAGVVMAVPGVPGPGLVVIFAGLSILAVDFVWAHRLQTRMKSGGAKILDKLRGRPPGRRQGP